MPILELWENVDLGFNKMKDGSLEIVLIDSAASGRMLKTSIPKEHVPQVRDKIIEITSGIEVATEMPKDGA